ncbi:hypothetical protein NDR87_01665 [Nocardia sp. CDC159]|uniref:Uncharacterized protein n=1 Tax=Nocardia pulmonis TaxID=2951408 RepID=A0A9X2IUM3_9NOCA|nr:MULTISPECIES: hypothetical protein [Nocardia]MCM6772283.1 hypothetical protein [Nocardia pulmonis]MCM6785059.1 hypothetical protein [Nocardia sp. CDC159]
MGQATPGAARWSVPIGTTRAEVARKPVATGFGAYCPPGWLLLELPTALLLATFVGTGWLGYAQHSGPPTDRPAQVVVQPAEEAGRRPAVGAPR